MVALIVAVGGYAVTITLAGAGNQPACNAAAILTTAVLLGMFLRFLEE